MILLLILLLLNPASSCNWCHSNATLMEDYPEFIVSNEQVWNESKMYREGLGGPNCEDCHLGNSSSFNKEEAHRGLLTLTIVSREKALERLNRSSYPEIKNYSSYIALNLIKEPEKVKTVLYHDRNKDDYAFNFTVANETCGKCHSKQVEDYLTSYMANTEMQSKYPNFTFPAPHNCGYWLVNFTSIKEELSVNYSLEQAELNNRVCQQCHTSCLDCHYSAFETEKKHSFSRRPSPLSCYFGGGRGICHVGAEDYRRGSGYFREAGGYPSLEDDVHAKEMLSCLECHTYDNHNITREATCQDCHLLQEKEVSKSSHSKLECESCHVSEAVGYQLTFWAPGNYYNKETPLAKLNSYGILDRLLLIKDEDGKWIPTKPMPHAVLNINRDVEPSSKVEFRKIPGVRNKSRDAYYIVGTFNIEGIKALAWVHMDKISHGFGSARSCEDCHSSEEQRLTAYWQYPGEHTGEDTAFSGITEITANSSGVYFKIYNTTPVMGASVNFAPWLHGLRWEIKGDFSLPEKSSLCIGKNCLRCHEDYHATVKPKYKKEAYLVYLILLIFSGIIFTMVLSYYRKINQKL